MVIEAFSSEVGTDSREENGSKQKSFRVAVSPGPDQVSFRLNPASAVSGGIVDGAVGPAFPPFPS
jgi:hypothetical protein